MRRGQSLVPFNFAGQKGMMKLEQLFAENPQVKLGASLKSRPITGVEQDSRNVKAGQLFACLPFASTGDYGKEHVEFSKQALAKGAQAVLVPRVFVGIPQERQIVTKDVRQAYGLACAAFFGWPARRLKLLGVTGTNGKTTTTFLLRSIFEKAGLPTAVLGTVAYYIGKEVIPAPNTTPSALEIQRLLGRAVEKGCCAAAMEVSSHALDQKRTAGCEFDAAIFSNLTQDHLDYHKTMTAYRAAKGRLFESLGQSKKSGIAVLNRDDAAWNFFFKKTAKKARKITYSIKDTKAEVRAEKLKLTMEGAEFRLCLGAEKLELKLPLAGRFNVSNALAAASAAWGLGIPAEAIVGGLEKPQLPPGRLEKVAVGQKFLVLVDYAHTPDALERVLQTLKEFASKRIITVFGCGGDRDPGKRPLMGKIAYDLSDLVIVTSDNPRSEDPEKIIEQVMAGIPDERGQVRRVLTLVDRKTAIQRALKVAQPGDVVLLAGKGHEDYQIIGKQKFPFDDREVARETLKEMLLKA